MDADFQAALDRFVVGVQALIDADYAKNFPNSVVPKLEIDPNGKKYIRIVKVGQHQRAVWAFVSAGDVVNKALSFGRGDVAKAASWDVPAKHARGNIFDASNGLSRCTSYGPAYL